MKILLSFLLLLNYTMLFAQQKTGIVITRDTINISGYVYNYDGTPCAGATITSRQLDTIYNLSRISVVTDKNGYFKLNGAKFNDTLWVSHLNSNIVFNKGSRYLVLYIPFYVKQLSPIEVTARKKQVKPGITFTTKLLKTENDNGNKVFWEEGGEKEPEYPGGMGRYRQIISSKLIYPQKAVEDNIEGTVEIGFTVLRDGTVANYKILRGLGFGCDEEVIRVMTSMPKWKPGIVNGRPMEVDYMMDIEFKLTDK